MKHAFLHFDFFYLLKQFCSPFVNMQKAGFYLIENPIKVYWGDISQVQVEYLLFETALSHGPYAYFLYC